MEKSKSHAALYWGIPLVTACVYFGGYGAVRSVGLLSRHIIGGEGAAIWVSGCGPIISGGGNWTGRVKEDVALSLEVVFSPLCRAEAKFWTWKYSGEDEYLLLISLPAR